MAPRVTVVMPVYNGERFIAEAIESVLASSYADFELLVLDDGSTDGSAAVARLAADGDPRVRVIELPRCGIGATRNVGLEEARGEFIANLDSDDVMFRERLAVEVAYLDRHRECVAAATRSVAIDDDGRPFAIIGRYHEHAAIDAALLSGNGGAYGSDSVMMRRATLESIGGYEASLAATGEDHDLWLRLGEIGQLVYLPQVLNAYRVHMTNVSIGEGSRERRLPVTLATLGRAFERRGIVDRKPAKLPAPALTRSERLRDTALVRYFVGDRAGALVRILGAALMAPWDVFTRSALRTIVSRPRPTWGWGTEPRGAEARSRDAREAGRVGPRPDVASR